MKEKIIALINRIKEEKNPKERVRLQNIISLQVWGIWQMQASVEPVRPPVESVRPTPVEPVRPTPVEPVRPTPVEPVRPRRPVRPI